jgi:AhpD family alkylhydroperoxidase
MSHLSVTKERAVSETEAVKYEREIPDVLQAMAGVHKAMDAHGFDRTIHHLVLLRASQINQCAHCVKLHTREARQDGESNERLDKLVVWKHVGDFSEREKAALAWTEALTVLGGSAEYGTLRARLRKHFTETEIGVLTSTVAMINLWNRIQVSRH